MHEKDADEEALLTALQDLGVPERHHVHDLKVTGDAGHVETSSIDKAMAAPGCARYVAGPGGRRS